MITGNCVENFNNGRSELALRVLEPAQFVGGMVSVDLFAPRVDYTLDKLLRTFG
jgi:hypothetical protein